MRFIASRPGATSDLAPQPSETLETSTMLQAPHEPFSESFAAAPRLEGGIALDGQPDFAGLAPPIGVDFGEPVAGADLMRQGDSPLQSIEPAWKHR